MMSTPRNRKRKSTMPPTPRKTRRKATKIYNLIESKDRYFSQNFTTTSGLPYFYNPLYFLANGTGDSARIGQKIYVQGFEYKFGISFANPNVADLTVRLTLVKSPAKKATGNVFEGFTVGTSALLNGDVPIYNTQAVRYDVAIVDPEVCTKVYDRVINIQQSDIARVPHKCIGGYIRINQEFVYSSNLDGYGKFWNYYWCITMIQSGTEVGTQTIGANDFSIRTIFKDA